MTLLFLLGVPFGSRRINARCIVYLPWSAHYSIAPERRCRQLSRVVRLTRSLDTGYYHLEITTTQLGSRVPLFPKRLCRNVANPCIVYCSYRTSLFRLSLKANTRSMMMILSLLCKLYGVYGQQVGPQAMFKMSWCALLVGVICLKK